MKKTISLLSLSVLMLLFNSCSQENELINPSGKETDIVTNGVSESFIKRMGSREHGFGFDNSPHFKLTRLSADKKTIRHIFHSLDNIPDLTRKHTHQITAYRSSTSKRFASHKSVKAKIENLNNLIKGGVSYSITNNTSDKYHVYFYSDTNYRNLVAFRLLSKFSVVDLNFLTGKNPLTDKKYSIKSIDVLKNAAITF